MKTIGLIYKLIGFGLVVFGISINLIGSANAIELISYFTMMVNTVIAVIFIIEILFFFKIIKINPNLFKIVKGSSISAAILMLIVYQFILIPYMRANVTTYQVYSLKDLFIHYVSPILILIDYVLFDEKGRFTFKDGLYFVNYLLAYSTYTLIYILLGGRFYISGKASIYPYFFLNIETQGLALTLMIMFAIIATYMITGYGFILLDRKLKRLIKN
jgi:hypothetical protein